MHWARPAAHTFPCGSFQACGLQGWHEPQIYHLFSSMDFFFSDRRTGRTQNLATLPRITLAPVHKGSEPCRNPKVACLACKLDRQSSRRIARIFEEILVDGLPFLYSRTPALCQLLLLACELSSLFVKKHVLVRVRLLPQDAQETALH